MLRFHLTATLAVISAAVLPCLLIQDLLHAPQAKLMYLQLLNALLIPFMFLSTFFTLSCRDGFEASLARFICHQLFGTVAFHAVLVLFGAPVIALFWETLMLAAIMASLTISPVLALDDGERFWVGKESVMRVLRVLVKQEYASASEAAVAFPAMGAMAGTWIGAFPIPLDWDRPWQAWPVTCVCGCLVGCIFGHVYAGCRGILEQRERRFAEKDD